MEDKIFEVWFAKETGRLLVKASTKEEAIAKAEQINDEDYNNLFELLFADGEDFPYDATEYKDKIIIDSEKLAIYTGN